VRDTIPCEVCGEPTPHKTTKRCNCCYEVECRLERYLKYENGRKFAETLLCARRAENKIYVLRYLEQGGCYETVGVFSREESAYERIELICSSPERRREFWDSFTGLKPKNLTIYNFHIEPFTLDHWFPVLDD